jgi:hypothetical protein
VWRPTVKRILEFYDAMMPPDAESILFVKA